MLRGRQPLSQSMVERVKELRDDGNKMEYIAAVQKISLISVKRILADVPVKKERPA